MNEAELLFTEVLGLSRPDLYLKRNLLLDKNESLRISAVLKRRLAGEPLPYILGKTEFMGLDFEVRPGVLIPRQETEILVEEALRIARSFNRSILKILDLGTGSGCIAISLAKNLAQAKIDAIDISEEAVRVARGNAERHGVRIEFMQGDLFGHSILRPGSYDLIVGNPPYIAAGDIATLAIEVRQEPLLALEAGNDGLDFFRRIAARGAIYLKESGYLMLEMGFGQRKAVGNIFEESGNFRIIRTTLDYQGIERVITMQRKAGYGQISS